MDDPTPSTSTPRLQLGSDHERALDQAIDMLSAMLRSEHASSRARSAEVLKGRLRNGERPSLRDRMREAAADGIETRS